MARSTVGQNFDPRRNALNLLRLFFAVLVIFSHAIVLGGYRSETLWGYGTVGGIAVDGFFAVSGFLIAASAMRNHVTRYMWQRVLRIFPAFWACLILTALLAGPIGWLAETHPLSGYWTAPNGPLHYVVYNWLLEMRTWSIAGTPARIPYPAAWDGSLWSLVYEFACYLMVALLAITALLRRRRVVLILWALSWAIALVLAADGVRTYFVTIPDEMIRFVPIFFAGTVLWLYRERVPDSPILFSGALLMFAIGTFLRNPDVVAGPPLAYVCIWASIHLPGKRVGTKYDISYGTYIYAFVVAQVLAVWHVYKWGYFPFTFLTLAVTLPLAGLSCVAIEQPALRLKRWSPRWRPVRTELTSSAPARAPSTEARVSTSRADGGGEPSVTLQWRDLIRSWVSTSRRTGLAMQLGKRKNFAWTRC